MHNNRLYNDVQIKSRNFKIVYRSITIHELFHALMDLNFGENRTKQTLLTAFKLYDNGGFKEYGEYNLLDNEIVKYLLKIIRRMFYLLTLQNHLKIYELLGSYCKKEV